MRLGELLISAGKITQADLEEALKGQAIFGGRLGTNLVEMGLVDELELAGFLSQKLGVPAITPDQLTNIPPQIVRLIPEDIVKKYRVVPVALNNRKLALAMADPSDFAAIDEISFRTGYIVVPHIVPELRLIGAMEKYYDIKRELRYIPVAGGGRARSRVEAGAAPGVKAAPTPPPAQAKPAPAPAPAAPEEEILELPMLDDLGTFGDLSEPDPLFQSLGHAVGAPAAAQPVAAPTAPAAPAASRPGTAAAPSSGFAAPAAPLELEPEPDYSLDTVLQGLADAPDRDTIADLVVGYAAQHFHRAGLFLVKGDRATGWLAQAGKKPLPGFENLEIHLNEPSMLKVVADSKNHYFGPVPITPANTKVLAALGGGRSMSHLLVPLLMMGRVVAILYVEGGPLQMDDWIQDLQKLLGKASMAFEILILKSKILLT